MGRILLSLVLLLASSTLAAGEEQDDTFDLPLDELLGLKVSAAAKYEQTTREAPASITIITAEDIAAYGFKTLEDVFRTVQGFYVSNDRNYSYVGVRGFSRPTDYNNRILLLHNGHSTNENVQGSACGGSESSLNMDAVERIEIVRGPGSTLYGTYAVFAVVNVITKDGNRLDGLRVSAELGSYGRRELAAAFGNRSAGGVDVSLSGTWADVDGQDLYYREFDASGTSPGIAEDLDWESYYSILGTCSIGGLFVQGYFANRKKGIPTAPWEIEFNDGDAKTLDRSAYAEVRYEREVGVDKGVTLRGYLDHYYYKGWYPYGTMFLDESDGYWAGGEFRLRWDPRTDNRLSVGAEFQNHFRARYREWDPEDVYFDRNNTYTLITYYVQNEYQATQGLAVTVGLRADRYSHLGTTVSPRGAIV